MIEIIESVNNNWDNKELLPKVLITISEKQLELANLIAESENTYNQAYLAEKESSYKATDSEVKARAKTLVGSNKTRYEYEFQALSNLLNIIILRISQLDRQ